MTNHTFDNLEKLIRAKDTNRLVIFAGAGVSINSGIPSWNKLIESLSEKIDLKNTKLDPLKVAQLYYNKRKHRAYYDFLKEELKHGQAIYNRINEQVLKLKPSHIVTTNYDDLFEQVVLKNRALYSIIRQNSDLPKSAFSNYLIKMHGCFSTENIVLTEVDYLNYSTNFSLIEGFIKGLFSSKIILFIGFSFDDINLKYILERVNNILGAGKQQHFIFFNEQKSQIEKEYFELKGLNPIFYDDIESYSIDLNENIDINPEGRKLHLFLKVLEKLDVTKYKLEKLPILNQIEDSLSQFLDMDFIMPELYNKLFPFNIEDGKSSSLREVFRRDSPLKLDLSNSKILELFNWISINVTSSPEKIIGKNIRSFDKLKESCDDINDEYIKQITHGIIKSTYEYQRFEGLVTVLNNSFIYYLNNQNIIIDRKKVECNCICCCFDRFDFKSVIEIIYRKEIKKTDYPSNCSNVKAYLIKGYFAHKFGLRDIAFESFKNAQNEAFIVNNEVIRFLSAYNLKNFKSGLLSDYLNNDYHYEEQKNINLEEILESLNLSEIVKEELRKILREIYIIEIGDLLRVRKGKFEEKRYLHDNGGRSSGGNDLEMNDVSGFRLLRFYEKNYLVDTEYTVLSDLAETTLETSLLSFMVKKVENVQKQRIWPNDNILNNFDEYHLHLFIHYSQKSWHKKKIKIILNGRLITLSDKAKLKLKENVKTFLNSFFQEIFGNEIVSEKYSSKISSDYTFKIFNNFLELITITDFNDEYVNEISNDIVNFLLVVNFPNWAEEKPIKDFFRSKGNLFSSNQLIQLIEIFIKKGVVHYMKELVDHIKDDNQKLVISIEDLAPFFKERSYNYLKALGYIHSLTNIEVRLKIEQHLEEKLMANFDSITFTQLYKYDCFDKEKLTKKYILEENGLLKETYPQENSVALNNFLQFISRNYSNPNIQKLAKEPSKNTYVDWLLNFDTFDYQYFKLDWFQYFITQLFIKFMKQNQDVKKQLREFLLINKDVELQNQYSRLYLENFEAIQ